MKTSFINKTLAILFLFLSFYNSNAQKEGDNKIIVQVNDTSNLYKKVKFSLINLDFIVKDLESDTLKTYPREFLDHNYLIATAIIKGYTVTITGILGSRKLNLFGYQTSIKDYKKATFYKGSIEWKILRLVAEGIGGEIRFEN